jgi:hypothetical protein
MLAVIGKASGGNCLWYAVPEPPSAVPQTLSSA